MSKCISQHGEYSEHEPSAADVYTCRLCGAYDDDRMHADLGVQAAIIQRVRDLRGVFKPAGMEGDTLVPLGGLWRLIEVALDGDQEPPERCGNCGGSGESFANVHRDRIICVACNGSGFDGGQP